MSEVVPRNVAIIKTSVWETGSEFRELRWASQWLYLMLISQRQINTCGVLAYTPQRWQHLAAAGTRSGITHGLKELTSRRFIIVDKTTSELLVRTFVKHDQVWKQPKLVVAARSQFKEILSETIRDYLAVAHPWIADPTLPVLEGVSEPLADTPNERGNGTSPHARARVRAHAGAQPPASLPLTPKEDLLPDKPARKRDELWDTLVEELGSAPSTSSERGRWNAALKQLREAGATAEELRTRCGVYRKRWPDVSLTPTALAANWGSLDSVKEMSSQDRWKRHFDKELAS